MGGARQVVGRLPTAPGVYRFRDERGRALYVGRAVDLRRRVASYWGDLRDRRHLTPMVARIARVEAVACDSEHEAAWLERNVLERAMPRWNRTPGGQEVPVHIRLDPRAGLKVVHSRQSQGRLFGPYLGGLRVRLAVSALDRVLPLAYAVEGLRGSTLDMARVRGVDSTDREALLRAVVGVLDREPEPMRALRSELVRRRDSASGDLAFELAARLQAEIEAVDWVTAEQKVTVDEPSDVDIHGWADGVLIRFEVRAGRLCAWRQRLCTEDAARRHVETTPPSWAQFARRNAELAATLK